MARVQIPASTPCGFSSLSVLSFAPRGFSLGTPVFLPAIDCTISCLNPAESQGHMSVFLISGDQVCDKSDLN